ncbi:MAG: NADP-dependent oxidoreductase [Geminicoccaceae bacterium]
MTTSPDINRQIILASRPLGFPKTSDFYLEQTAVPEAGTGEMLLRTEYLSLDPYVRLLLDENSRMGPSIPIGGTITGATVSRVVTSDVRGFSKGDHVVGLTGWQDFSVSDGTGMTNIGPDPEHPSWMLGVLGVTGLTAYGGMTAIGKPQPGETVVTPAATGAVGSIVGQMARIAGARAVGFASTADKCRYAVEELGFDACVDRLAPDMAERLAEACPDGIDVYFEMAGGKILKAVLPLLNDKARIPLCGAASQYNLSRKPEGPDTADDMMRLFQLKQVRIEGFLVMEAFADLIPEFTRTMTKWIGERRIRHREQVFSRLEDAPQAFIQMLDGGNIGKSIVKVAA